MGVIEAHVGGVNNISNYSSVKSIENFSIAEYHYDENKPTINPFSHQHLEYEFILILKTVPLLVYEKANYIGEVGYVYPVNPNVIHGIEFPLDESEIIDITVDMNYFDEIKKSLGFEGEYFYTRFQVSTSFIDLCNNFLKGNNNQFKEESIKKLIISSLIIEGLSDKTDRRRPEKKYAKNIKKILVYMYEHYNDPNLTIKDLAELSDYSITYFTKAFTAYMHDSPIVHLNKLRISEAKSLMLENKNLKFKEIALMVGFDNLSTFTESFRRVTGYAPKDFKAKYID